MDLQHLSPARKGIVGVQFLFVAFGATVLVPLLIGLDPAVALFTAGIGTLMFHLVTKGKVPIFLGSSFAFIAPILAATKLYGLAGALGGMVGVAAVYFIMSALIKFQGKKFIDRLFPPVVIGPVIMLIGLSLSGSAVTSASQNWLLAGVSLLTAICVLAFTKGLMKLIPVIMGIIVGYVVTLIFFPNLIDFSKVAAAGWLQLPAFVKPNISWAPIVYMVPVAIAPVIEHIGDIYAVGAVAGKDFVKDPGLHRTMFGDGLACLFSGIVGGPPETTYSEVTGAMSITKVTSPAVIRISAITAVVFSVIGKLSALLQTIPFCCLRWHNASAFRYDS
jgi:uracil permease